MLSSYGELFQVPGARAFSLSGAVARMPISQLSIAAILLVSAHTGSYALAGQISAAVTLAGAVMMPQIARLVDRHGQARIARPVLLASTTAWLLLALAVSLGWPTWTWFVFAILAGGTSVSIGSMVRARWMHVLPKASLQQRAFSWESSLDEVIFVTGPPLATFLATSIAPYAGILVAGILLLGGGWWFTSYRETEPPPSTERRVSSLRLLTPALLSVALVFVCAGTMFGAVDVIVVAFADEQGRKPMAGVILAAYALGSLFAGLTFGVLNFRRSVGGQFVIAATLVGVLAPLLLLGTNLWLFGAVVFVCGFSIAPLLISATILVERLVPPSSLTEGLTWSTTALVGGVTIGAAGAGSLIDAVGARAALWLPIGAAALAAIVAWSASPLLRHAAVTRTRGRLHASLVDAPAPNAPVAEIVEPNAT